MRVVLMVFAMLLMLARGVEAARPQIYTSPGERFKVTLDSNATTGYQWVVLSSPGVRRISQIYEGGTRGLAGEGGRQVFVFQSLRAGTTKLELGYRRSWEGSPVQTYTLVVSSQRRTSATETSTEAIYTQVDRRFSVVLHANRSRGLDWKIANRPDPGIVMLLGSEYRKPTTAGSGGHRTFRFRAVGVGSTTIFTEYLRLSGPATQAARAHSVVLTVFK